MAKQTTMTKYTADDMKELTGLDPIRQSPAQYVGSVAAVSAVHGKNGAEEGEALTAGGFHLFVETLANSSDEANSFDEDGKPYADYIEVILHEDQSITITDNGRGIPPDINKATGKSGLELTFLTMNAGGKFRSRTGQGAKNYSGSQAGTHGMGAACVGALSDRLDVTVWRNGKAHSFSAKGGVPGTFDGDAVRAKFKPSNASKGSVISVAKDSRSAAEKKKFPTGTRVHWHPDPKIWGGTDIPWKDICEAVEAQSYMAPTCTYRLIDETTLGGGSKKNPKVSEFHHPKGIYEMVEGKTEKTANLTPIVSFDVPASYTKKIVDEDENGNSIQMDVDYDIVVKVALRWTGNSGADIEGYANSVHCVGKHVDGLRRGLSRGVGNWVEKSGVMTKKDEQAKISPNIEDITDGMIAVIEVLLEDQCDFDSQMKESLTNTDVLSCVSDVVKDQIEQWLSTKKNSAAAKRVAKSVLESARLRAKQKKERENAKKIKSALGGLSSKPAKLLDCRNEGPGTELLICEGDSAGGTIKKVRDANWQAMFPVRGVSMNAYGAKASKILSNAEFSDLISAMRVGGIGEHCNLEGRRYERIGIYTDADEDGNYIRALLLVFIYTQFPGMIEAGKVFAGCPPLYYITYKTGKNKGKRVAVMNEAERDKLVSKYVKSGGKAKELDIQRSKGLGEDDEKDAEAWLSPKTRTVRVMNVDDVEAAKQKIDDAMSMLFGSSDVCKQQRRQWIDDTFVHEVE